MIDYERIEKKKIALTGDNEERFRLLLSAASDYAIIMLDIDGVVVSWAEGAHRIKGYLAHEIIGQHFSKFYPQVDIDAGKPEHELTVAAATGRFEDEGWRLRKDGSQFFANVVITALVDEDGRLRGFAKLTRDITERKEAERLLRETEERFRLLMAGVKDYAIIILDKTGRIVSWNEGAHRIKGYDEQEIIGQHFSIFYLEEDLEAGKPAHGLQVASACGRFEDEGWRLRKDGSRFFANVVISSLVDDHGQLRGFAKITRDITERKEAEIRINEFYSILSHELRSPLTSIRGTLGLLEGGIVGEQTADAAEVTANARLSCDRLIRLVNDLLDLSKMDAGQFKLVKTELLPLNLINEIVGSNVALIGQTKTEIEIVEIDNVVIWADHDRIIQVLTNLLSNAIKFTPAQSKVRVAVRIKSNMLCFSITDNGPGIPSTGRDKLFGKFQQIDMTDSRLHEGTGLGLAISKSIVEQHGGEIGFDSEFGSGATFWFSIPLGRQGAALISA